MLAPWHRGSCARAAGRGRGPDGRCPRARADGRGFRRRSRRATGQAGLEAARFGGYDAVVLDIMLPRLSGYTVVQTLRAEQNWVPVLILSAKDGEYDEADGLDYGADDYLTKPFSFVVLRGPAAGPAPPRPGAAPGGAGRRRLMLDPAAHRVERGRRGGRADPPGVPPPRAPPARASRRWSPRRTSSSTSGATSTTTPTSSRSTSATCAARSRPSTRHRDRARRRLPDGGMTVADEPGEPGDAAQVGAAPVRRLSLRARLLLVGLAALAARAPRRWPRALRGAHRLARSLHRGPARASAHRWPCSSTRAACPTRCRSAASRSSRSSMPRAASVRRR